MAEHHSNRKTNIVNRMSDDMQGSQGEPSPVPHQTVRRLKDYNEGSKRRRLGASHETEAQGRRRRSPTDGVGSKQG